MATVSTMTPQQQKEAGHDPHREQYLVKTIVGRIQAIERAYTLHDSLENTRGLDEYDSVLDQWARESGRSRWALTDEAFWAERIPRETLHRAFAAEGIDIKEWAERIDPGHLLVIARATDQATHRVLSPKEMAQIAVETFHATWTVAELRDALRQRGLLAPEKQGLAGTPTKGITACQALRQLADYLERTGRDFPMAALHLNPTKSRRPMGLFELFTTLRDRYFSLYPQTLVPREMVEQWSQSGAQPGKKA